MGVQAGAHTWNDCWSAGVLLLLLLLPLTILVGWHAQRFSFELNIKSGEMTKT